MGLCVPVSLSTTCGFWQASLIVLFSSEPSDHQQKTAGESWSWLPTLQVIKETRPRSFSNPLSAPHQPNAPPHYHTCPGVGTDRLLSRTVHVLPYLPKITHLWALHEFVAVGLRAWMPSGHSLEGAGLKDRQAWKLHERFAQRPLNGPDSENKPTADARANRFTTTCRCERQADGEASNSHRFTLWFMWFMWARSTWRAAFSARLPQDLLFLY